MVEIKAAEYEIIRLSICHHIIRLDSPDNCDYTGSYKGAQEKIAQCQEIFDKVTEKIIESGLQEIRGCVNITSDEYEDLKQIRAITSLKYDECRKIRGRYLDELADKS